MIIIIVVQLSHCSGTRMSLRSKLLNASRSYRGRHLMTCPLLLSVKLDNGTKIPVPLFVAMWPPGHAQVWILGLPPSS